MMDYGYIKTIHLEITDKCNAACPQCPRNDRGGQVNPLLPLTELTLDKIKKIFPNDFIKQLELMYACGNYGDPAFAKETDKILQHFRNLNEEMALSIITNGGIQPESWWRNLAKIIGKKGHITFSIDGLKDTNHIYRRNVKWKILIRNIEAYIKAGGKAHWDFIVFKHNEHQVEEARKLANDLGFVKFETKKTGRFFYEGKFLDSTPVKNNQGEVVDKIERPSDQWSNKALTTDLQHIINQFGSMKNYYNQTEIKCKVKKKGSLYVSADGYIFPCCWLAGMATYNQNSPQKQQMLDLIEGIGGINKINALEYNLKDIIEGDFLKKIAASWKLKSIQEGKLLTCSRICGETFDQYGSQKNN